MNLSNEVLKAAQSHAIEEFPKEACGLIVDGVYERCVNYATCPKTDFKIAGEVWAKFVARGSTVEAVIHSHPNGPIFPTAQDMQGQIDTNVPWVIIATDGSVCASPTIWGDKIPPIIGREFVHGVTDCYSLIRHVFALGKNALALQGIDWPFDPIELSEVPRNDCWWGTDEKPGDDLYAKYFEREGFKIIPREDARPGDGFLAKIKSKQLNHGGLFIGGGLILHHLPMRLSRREPAGIWSRAAEVWMRYEGKNA
jgi:proteasome lid subunit RPN8/RPN11